MRKINSRNRRHKRRRYRLIVREVCAGIAVLFLILAMIVLYNGVLKDHASGGDTEVRAQQGTETDISVVSGVTAGEASGETSSEGSGGESGEIPGEESEDWKLILVNRWHPLPDDYEVTVTNLRNDQAVDSRIYPNLQKMFDDMRAEGLMPKISSSYRTTEEQQAIMDEKIEDYQAEGNDRETAVALAEKWVAIPGTSEHELGMAVDITSEDSDVQDASIIWQWLNENSWKYGFIQRYPEDKTDITGIIYESWHYRYVGRDAAQAIYEQGVCLEEYLDEVQ